MTARTAWQGSALEGGWHGFGPLIRLAVTRAFTAQVCKDVTIRR